MTTNVQGWANKRWSCTGISLCHPNIIFLWINHIAEITRYHSDPSKVSEPNYVLGTWYFCLEASSKSIGWAGTWKQSVWPTCAPLTHSSKGVITAPAPSSNSNSCCPSNRFSSSVFSRPLVEANVLHHLLQSLSSSLSPLIYKVNSHRHYPPQQWHGNHPYLLAYIITCHVLVAFALATSYQGRQLREIG
jgi:hypothetical protein